ncbi:MAG TPA: hypothetical protein VK507_15925 [Iamia sp.]|nr:hypothetical protein [Iamia sp.]
MKSLPPTNTLVKRGLARPAAPKPACPALARRGRWSPPAPQG